MARVLAYVAQVRFRERELGPMMREGGAQKMLNEYCTVLNQYFDRECE